MFGKLKTVGITKGLLCKVVTHSPTLPKLVKLFFFTSVY